MFMSDEMSALGSLISWKAYPALISDGAIYISLLVKIAHCSCLFSGRSEKKSGRLAGVAVTHCSYLTNLTRCLMVCWTKFNVIWRTLSTAFLYFWG